MKVLIVRKPTNFELHGERVRKNVENGTLDKNNLERLKRAHDQHYQSVELVRDSLTRHKVSFEEMERNLISDGLSLDNSGPLFTLGGDGTLLSVGHHIQEHGQIIGIRSSDASVGYLCAGGYSEIDELVSSLVDGSIEYLSISRLQAKIRRAATGLIETTPPIINDFLFTATNPAATTRYKIIWQSKEEHHKSSGIWISTATGSTAGILTAGGEIMPMTSPQYQFVVRELYRQKDKKYHNIRGIFNEEGQSITIENRSEGAILALDGQHGVIQLAFGDQIKFSKGINVLIAKPQSQP